MPARRDAGFTLLEVLIALSIVGFLSLILLANVGLGARVWEQTDARSAALAERAVLERVFRRHLTRAVPVAMEEIAGRRAIFFEGDAKQMRFFSELDVPTLGAGIYGLRLEIVERDGAAILVFRRGFPALGASREIDWDATELGMSAPDARFLYFGPEVAGGAPTWHSEWSGRYELPYLVRLAFGPDAGDDSVRSITVAPMLDWSAVRAPRVTVDAYFADD